MAGYLERLKEKWGIRSGFQLTVVLIVFAITGSASVWLAKPVLRQIGIDEQLSPWVRIPLRLIMIFPVYQVLLLTIGGLFGQFHFFLNLQKKWFRIGKRKKVGQE
jgi:hypothetical protein